VTGIVAIVAVTEGKKLILVEQFRPPLQKRVIELPAGLAGDVPGAEEEELAVAAQRELEEETGYTAKTMKLAATGVPSAGLCDEIISIFVAEGLMKTGDGGGDASEDIVVHEVPVDHVLAWLEQKQKEDMLVDLKVYTGLCFVQRH
jgi:ADP-ribose pyrophosphatase